jgi:hypothetical protein
MSMVMPLQAYELKLAPHPAPFSILKFAGVDKISQLYWYEIEFTSPMAGIPMDQVLGRPARFVIAPIDPNMGNLRRMYGENAERFSKMPPAHTIHGIITKFDECETSADETRYRVILEPKLADLNRGVTSRLFQKQSVEEIITDTLRHYGYRAGVDFVFKLRGKYKRHEYITQYHETTFAFIQRICAEEGIWFRWEQKKDYAVVVFGDDLDAYARKQRIVPYRLRVSAPTRSRHCGAGLNVCPSQSGCTTTTTGRPTCRCSSRRIRRRATRPPTRSTITGASITRRRKRAATLRACDTRRIWRVRSALSAPAIRSGSKLVRSCRLTLRPSMRSMASSSRRCAHTVRAANRIG